MTDALAIIPSHRSPPPQPAKSSGKAEFQAVIDGRTDQQTAPFLLVCGAAGKVTRWAARDLLICRDAGRITSAREREKGGARVFPH